jgi:hypothetical protein
MPSHDGSERESEPTEIPESAPIFKWETLRVVGPYLLRYKEPIHGQTCEVELSSGQKVNVFRADDGQFYFCHGLTFGSKDAPGGALSPFSGEDVQTILTSHYSLVDPESKAVAGDILVWRGPSGKTPHSAILINPVVTAGKHYLDYDSTLRSKNGMEPEATMTLLQLVEGPDGYGESYNVFRRK